MVIVMCLNYSPMHKFEILAAAGFKVGWSDIIYRKGEFGAIKVMVKFVDTKYNSNEFTFHAVNTSFSIMAAAAAIHNRVGLTIKVELFSDGGDS